MALASPDTDSLAFVPVAHGVSLSPGAAQHHEPLGSNLFRHLAELHREFEPKRQKLLAQRKERQASWDAGSVPTYLPQNSANRPEWQIATVPADMSCRRVEITGPVNSAKMVIQMLMPNSDGLRADCAMLDFEDSMKPTWSNVLSGFQNVLEVVEGTLCFSDPDSGKSYQLDTSKMAKMMVRVRGLHLDENNLTVDGQPICAGLFDLAVVSLLTAKTQVERGETPSFYVPKLEDHEEAVWWNSLFARLEDLLELPNSSLRATFLIETLPAAFQMEEILFALRDHVLALNVGRWDKIFSDLKVLRYHSDRVLADRSYINMDRPWMANYAKRLVRICHLHGAYALGGMAAFTPGRDQETRQVQQQRVSDDKTREFAWGHDGCWVSHPFFIGSALAAFKATQQLAVIPDTNFHQPDLLPSPEGPKTLAGLRQNIRVGIAYLHGWQHGLGCISWDNLMEDLATLEISRASVWQWLHHRVVLAEGIPVTQAFVSSLFEEELGHICAECPDDLTQAEAWQKAAESARDLFLQEDFQEFLSFGSDLELP